MHVTDRKNGHHILQPCELLADRVPDCDITGFEVNKWVSSVVQVNLTLTLPPPQLPSILQLVFDVVYPVRLD